MNVSTVHHPLYIGGLMRCCIESVRQYEREGGEVKEGTIVKCRYCRDGGDGVIFKNKAWRWLKAPEGTE